uniref:hypothetical protein n=1 Tax=Vibrio vulnificus TaxID=672 RepID=UPI00057C56B7
FIISSAAFLISRAFNCTASLVNSEAVWSMIFSWRQGGVELTKGWEGFRVVAFLFSREGIEF